MDSRAPLPPSTASSPARASPTALQQHNHHQPPRSPDSIPYDSEYVLNEKDAYYRHSQNSQNSQLHPSGVRSHDSVISHPFSPKGSTPPSPVSSVSSAVRHDRKHHDIQPSSPASVSIQYPSQAHFDPEKQAHYSPRSPRSPTRVSRSNPDVTSVLYDSGDYDEKDPSEKAVQLLLYLSGPCALVSFIIALWSLFCLFLCILLAPFRNFKNQLTTFLAPALNLQLCLIYSYPNSTTYSPTVLLVIHFASPFLAMGVAIASWTAAFFWFFSTILGDPAGKDGHNDGRESIVGVRNWWDRWLSRALR